MAVLPTVHRLARPRWTDCALLVWFAGWYLAWSRHGGMAWHFFVQGQQALGDTRNRHSGGLHLYAGLPQLQIGPLALLTARLISPFGPHVSQVTAQALGAAAGVAILWLTRRIALRTRPDLSVPALDRRTRLAAVPATPVWLYLAVASVHLDDVLAMLCATLAVLAATGRRPVPAGLLTGLLVGLAVDAKPWALPFAAALLIVAGTRGRLAGAAALVATIGAGWLPFVLADPATLNAVRFTIANTPYSGLRTLTVDTPRTPAWDRPAQAVLGLFTAVLAVRRGRWAAVILVAVAARMVLDPGTNMYYPGGLVAGAVLWDLAGSGLKLPWWTALSAGPVFGARYLPLPPAVHGWVLLGCFAACLLLAADLRTVAELRAVVAAGWRRCLRAVRGRSGRAPRTTRGRAVA